MPAKHATGAERSIQVGFEDRIPLGFRDFEGRGALGAAGTVDQDLHAAEFSLHRLQKLFEAGGVGDIAGLSKRPPPQRLDFGGRGGHLFGAASSGHNVRARLGQRPGEGKSDAAGSADHNRGLVRQVEKRVSHLYNFLGR